jgi:hypothetical protein
MYLFFSSQFVIKGVDRFGTQVVHFGSLTEQYVLSWRAKVSSPVSKSIQFRLVGSWLVDL